MSLKRSSDLITTSCGDARFSLTGSSDLSTTNNDDSEFNQSAVLETPSNLKHPNKKIRREDGTCVHDGTQDDECPTDISLQPKTLKKQNNHVNAIDNLRRIDKDYSTVQENRTSSRSVDCIKDGPPDELYKTLLPPKSPSVSVGSTKCLPQERQKIKSNGVLKPTIKAVAKHSLQEQAISCESLSISPSVELSDPILQQLKQVEISSKSVASAPIPFSSKQEATSIKTREFKGQANLSKEDILEGTHLPLMRRLSSTTSIETLPETKASFPSDEKCSMSKNIFLKRKSAIQGSRIVVCALVLILCLTSFMNMLTSPSLHGFVDPDSVYAPGGGFGGFYFSLGVYESIHEPETKNFYCYSAGCLGVVAIFNGYDFYDAYGMPLNSQQKWKNGTISRFEVVGDFVDSILGMHSVDLLHRNASANANATRPTAAINSKIDTFHASGASDYNTYSKVEDPAILSRINIITSSTRPSNRLFGMLTHKVRSPENIHELKKMLIQSAWIPFVTGETLWHRDFKTNEFHMDGGLTSAFHPQCKYSATIPMTMFDVVLNTLNMNLSFEKAEKFWKHGKNHGLHTH